MVPLMQDLAEDHFGLELSVTHAPNKQTNVTTQSILCDIGLSLSIFGAQQPLDGAL
jgi:hypothetical protein